MKAYGRRSTNSMTYKIKYLPLAVQDLNDVARYLSGFYPKTASRVLKEMRDKITKLSDNPKMCEIYPLDPVYHKMVIDQYLVFYQVNDHAGIVEIHRILRGSWNLPQYLEYPLRVQVLWTMLHQTVRTRTLLCEKGFGYVFCLQEVLQREYAEP